MDGIVLQPGMIQAAAAAVPSLRDAYLAEQITQGVNHSWFFEISSGISISDEIASNNLTLQPNSGGLWTGGTLGDTSLWAGSTSANFNGSSGYAITDSAISLSDFNGFYVECLFYHTSGQAGTLMSNGAGILLATTGSNALTFNLGGGFVNRGFIPEGWNIVGLNFRSNNAYRMMINGSIIASGTALGTASTSKIYIGSDNSGSGSFHAGRILAASVYRSTGTFSGSSILYNTAFA